MLPLSPMQDHAALAAAFRWDVPARYNIAASTCDRWAAQDPDRVALIEVADDGHGPIRETTFRDLHAGACRLANVLVGLGLGGDGVTAGDRVAILLPQRLETALAHLAAYRTGCVALPLFTLFGPDALRHRLRDSGAAAVITDTAGLAVIRAIRADLPALRHVLVVDGPVEAGPGEGIVDVARACAAASPEHAICDTAADAPALLIYTSGTTGQPKGALHAHRVLFGHLPGVEMSHDFLPQPGDRIWTPADWAWIGGLLDVLMPALHHGVPVVACRFRKFTATAAADLIRRLGIRNAFLPPTALKIMKADPASTTWGLQMRSVASGGEPLGTQLLDWGRQAFGVTINEFYGQTECNMVVSACGALADPEPGVMGWPVPGHRVAVIDEGTGQPLAPGVEGGIAVLAPDPVMFLGYWNNPAATAAKFVTGPEGRWLLTGDRGVLCPDGRLRFVGRGDDIISTAGYRVGPGEIEDCLLSHPAVRLAGVVGQPDPVRGEIVVAFVVLREGCVDSDELRAGIADHVRTRLAAHEYPRAIHVLDDLPMTTTGKIIRAELRRRLTG
jgi:acetyl-CoA synthetase